jgi:S-adenosylmethionine:tRNA ribosyltransferase-isomerase
VRTADFEYDLPPELIAQHPAPTRDASRMLALDRASGRFTHSMFAQFPDYLRAGDVLALNNSRVVPARLRGTNEATGGGFELLLLEETGPNNWWAMVKPGKRARVGTRIQLRNRSGEPAGIAAVVQETNEEGHRRLVFTGVDNIFNHLESLGEIPLPPYISRAGAPDSRDAERYQTVFAEARGSVAAPTAGLHFTEAVLDAVRRKGVGVFFVTLHVGLGTFAPVKVENLSEHPMHEERYELPEAAAKAISKAKADGRRVFAVGTTTLRVLESAALAHGGVLTPGPGRTRLFVYPPRDFKIVDALLTNFHLPRSTLLMLVSAFASPGATSGRELVLTAYAAAAREKYRFFSYGDAMLLV